MDSARPVRNRNAFQTAHAVPTSSHYHREKSPACFADRKSTRLNSSHSQISYAVFCLKKKKRYNEIVLMIIQPITIITHINNSLQYVINNTNKYNLQSTLQKLKMYT